MDKRIRGRTKQCIRTVINEYERQTDKMIRIQQLKLNPGHSEEQLVLEMAKALKIKKESIISYRIAKKSIDARKKKEIKFVYAIDVEIPDEKAVLKKVNNNSIMLISEKAYQFPAPGNGSLAHRPIVIGTGPAGLYCGLFLARNGYRPILLERGEDVKKRMQTVNSFWTSGMLNTASNVQFGEGGAGTFSDGKLNTLVKDPAGRNRKVLEVFVEAGAPSEILYLNKPHIGTDVLSRVVGNIREEIRRCGGEVRFESQVTDIEITDGRISSVIVNGNEKIDAEVVVLAIGHSARDTFEMLYRNAVPMEQKSFAVGVRIEHPQKLINMSQYGSEANPHLPAADYKLVKQLKSGRSIYSFCMCPGGHVVNASSEEGRLAVNGMSYHARNSRNANSAMIVTVTPEDFGSGHALAGVEFQRRLEEKAFAAGGGRIPVQLFGDFCMNRASTGFGDIEPCMKGEYSLTNLREALPAYLAESLAEGIGAFDSMIKGFGRKDAVLSGIESRTSSPVRISRNEFFESGIAGLYPCGEGAGYAGGITSAAMDGIKVAEAVAKKYHPL